MSNEILKQIAENIIVGKAPVVKDLVQKAIDAQIPVKSILEEGLMAGMAVVGDRFKKNEFYVPNVLVAARAMNMGMTLLKPLLKAEGVKARGVVLMGTVKGDLHDIGKNLVCMMLEGAGFNVIDLGVNVDEAKYIAAIKEHRPQIVGMSALLTTTMSSIGTTIEAFKTAGVRDQVKVMVGGAPLTQSFADSIGADGYSADAASAADLAVKLMVG
jgi:5-methyltetrahydrofolate--homocysteine methyltransferase